MFALLSRSRELAAVANALDKSQAVIEFKPDGTIITANANFLNAMGYVLPEIRGKHHSLFVDADYKQSQEYKQLVLGQPSSRCVSTGRISTHS